MNIESARALKTEIASQVVPPAVSAIHRAGGFSITTFSLNKMTKAEPLVADISKRAKSEVDVRFVGRVSKHALPWYRTRQRPLLPGSSVGHFKITAGTIGAIAREKKTNRDVILSNNHVLANENVAKIGDAILQAGAFDGGAAARDTVAKLSKWIH